MIALQSILFFLVIPPIGSSQTCRFQYIEQPPIMLDCDPLGMYMILKCTTASSSDNVTWYWTQNVSEAGVNGTAILPGDTSDNYQVTNTFTNHRGIGFTVSESILGYYWCEISNAVNVSLRPSTITPVCIPMSSSQQNKCNISHISALHHDDTDECAEENSPTVIHKPPLPTSCDGSLTSTTVAVATTPTPSATTMTSTVNSTMNTITTTSVLPTPQQSALVPAVVTVGVVVVVLVVVVVIIIVLVCVVRMNKTAATKDKKQISTTGPEVLNQQPLMELKNVYYSTCDHQPNVDKQEAVPEYSAVGGSNQQQLMKLENVCYSTCDHQLNVNKHEAVPEYSVVGESAEKNDYSVTNSEYARWSRVTPMYSEVTSKPTAEPGTMEPL